MVHPTSDPAENYEKMEIVGDAVLECLVACNALREMWREREGASGSRIQEAAHSHTVKVRCVNNDTLARYGVILGLDSLLQAKESVVREAQNFSDVFSLLQGIEGEPEFREPPKVLGDLVEALLCALFLDGGFPAVANTMEPLMGPYLAFQFKFLRLPVNACFEELSKALAWSF